ncbi:MAG: acyltransferase family protein [Myxococcales bacterium]
MTFFTGFSLLDSLQFAESSPAPRAAAPAPETSPKLGFSYQPALDGLRALCVLAIMLYHADLPWLPGGFLGVEVFFVISGYLITSLMRAEFAQSGRIDLVAFWGRRARRLLPALWALLLAVSVAAVAFLPGEVWRLRGEVAAGLTYVSNWYSIFRHESYFESVGRPSLLRHLWSLAIEEQFYLVWPPLFAVLARRFSGRTSGLLCAALAAASGLWMALRVVPGEDPSALYYDSFARAAAMLLGGALACLWAPRSAPSVTPRKPLVDLLGLGGLAGLLAASMALGEADAVVFRGGLLLVDLCALLVIVALVHPQGGLLKRALAVAPLRFVGTRSYGLYLWHWPLFALTRPGLDLPLEGTASLALRFTAAFVLAELSFRFVEEPVRSGRFMKALRAVWESRARVGYARAILVGGFVCALSCVFVTHGFVRARPPQEPNWETTLPAPGNQPTLTGSAPLATSSAAIARAEQQPGAERVVSDGVAERPHVLIFGDSVVLGARNYLRQGHESEVEFDSEIGRTSSTGLPRLRKLARQKKLPRVVIIHLGNNGWVYEEQVHEMMTLLEGVERVVFVNAHVNKRWQDRNNATLAAALAQHPRAVLVDWLKASEKHREWFGADGLHLTPIGAAAFAALLSPYYAIAP